MLGYENKFEGFLFERLSSESQEASISIDDGKISIYIDDRVIASELEIANIQDAKNINFVDGRLFVPTDVINSEILEKLTNKRENFVRNLEIFTVKKSLILSLILVFFIVGFRASIPHLASFAVRITPQSVEQEIGRNIFKIFEDIELLPTDLPRWKIDAIKQRTKPLFANTNIEIKFKKSGIIGANALAFPGGPIVITDDLVRLLDNEDFIVGVVAHEIAHIKLHHSLNLVYNTMGAGVLATIVFGSNESILEEISAVSINAWAMSLSRKSEMEADLTAIEILNESGMNPRLVLDALRTLFDKTCLGTELENNCGDSGDWMSSHPASIERFEYLENAILKI